MNLAFAELRQCREAVRAANYDLEEALKRHFPIGSSVRWEHGQYVQNGIVEEHGYGATLFARNTKTRKLVRISDFEILQAATRDARDAVSA